MSTNDDYFESGSQNTGKFILAKRDFELYDEDHKIYPAYRISFKSQLVSVYKNTEVLFSFPQEQLSKNKLKNLRSTPTLTRMLEALRLGTIKTVEEFKSAL